MISRRYWVALAGLLVAGVVAAALIWVTRPAQFTLSMRPARTPTTAACVSEAHAYGYSVSAGKIVCASAVTPRWYHAVLVNNGSYALADCLATGYDSGGNAIFHGTLAFTFAGPRGLFAGHGRTAFYWFLPQPTTGPVLRYVASCSASPNPF